MAVAIAADLTKSDPFSVDPTAYDCFGGLTLLGVVTNSTHQLVNPAGSGVVVVLDAVFIGGTAGDVFTSAQVAANALSAAGVRMNLRGSTPLTALPLSA